jgi:hypothetical protein
MKVREILCDYSPYIPEPPSAPDKLYSKAASNDAVTIKSWSETWISNIKANHSQFGDFGAKGIGNLFGRYLHRPVICAGSGPSLKYNIDELRDRKGIPLVSCLHNFQYFEDNDVKADFYVSLDAGPVTIEEVYEGGKEKPESYWEKTAEHTLLCYIGTDPGLLEKWRGEVYFFNAPVPDESFKEQLDEITTFNQWVSNGGNVLGACMYISKGYMGAGAIVYVGADFSFGYDKKFHSWDSKYDAKMGQVIPTVDVFGNRVATWPSYNNFKSWFDWVATVVPGVWINCTEGGTMGAYPQGNLFNIRQMDLKDCIRMYSLSDILKPCAMDAKVDGDDGIRILF